MTEFVQTAALGILIGGVYALAGSGLSLIYGVMGIINFSHGALLILAGYISYILWSWSGVDPLLSVGLAAPVMFGLGWLLYMGSFRRIRDEFVGYSVLLPFGLWLLLEGLMGVVWGNNVRSVRPSYADASVQIGSMTLPTIQLLGLALAAVSLALLVLFLRFTWAGRAIRASSKNPVSAALVGVDVGSVSALTFGVGFAVTAAGGSILGVMYPFVPGSGGQWLVILLAIVVLGGMGSIVGTVIAAMAMGLAEILTATYVGLIWTAVIPYVVLLLVLLLRPGGLMGVRLREEAR